jgi:hypothetical protein
MLKLYTSRYQNRAIPDSGLVPVGFTRGNPRFPLPYKVVANLREIAPTQEMFHIYDRAEFEPLYRAHIATVGVMEITTRLSRLSPNATGFVMLCFEDVRLPGMWCHRLVFGDWWYEQTGERVVELDDPSEPKVPGQKSARLPKPKAEGPRLEQGRFVVGRLTAGWLLRWARRQLSRHAEGTPVPTSGVTQVSTLVQLLEAESCHIGSTGPLWGLPS